MLDKDENTPISEYCFVCDDVVCGLSYNISSSITTTTQIKVPEKLDQMVGDEFVVVVHETDIICRGCWNILNTMDRLEAQLNGLRTRILEYMEKKYELDPGTLVNQNKKNPSSLNSEEQSQGLDEVVGQTIEVNNEDDHINNEKDSLLCEKCTFVTPFKSMMVYHKRQHRKEDEKLEEANKKQKYGNNEEEEVDDDDDDDDEENLFIIDDPINETECRKNMESNEKLKEQSKISRIEDTMMIEDSANTELNVGDLMMVPGDVESILRRVMEETPKQSLEPTTLKKHMDIQGHSSQLQGNNLIIQMQDNSTDLLINESSVVPPTMDLQSDETESNLYFVVDRQGGKGKIVQKIRKTNDGGFLMMEIDDPSSMMTQSMMTRPMMTRPIIHELEDGSMTLVSMPFDIGDTDSSVLVDHTDIQFV